jgi:replicative DNA helicase
MKDLRDIQEKLKLRELNTYKTPEQLVEQWAERVQKSIDRPLTTGFSKIDQDLDLVLRGEVCAVIGYGGTKKSLWALNQANRNSSMFNTRTIYSTMEMSPTRLLDRIIDFAHVEENPREKENIHRAFRQAIKNGNIKQVVKDLQELLGRYYGDRLIIDWQPSMNYDRYKTLIEDVEARYGEVDSLVVDGLSMMEARGSETEAYSQHTKELKMLANAKDIFIPVICHCSKGGQPDERDIQRFVRGSEKITDNVDFYMMFSKILNNEGEQNKDYGWIRFVNKRGTGNIIDQVYKFNQPKLCLEDTDISPSQFERSSLSI